MRNLNIPVEYFNTSYEARAAKRGSRLWEGRVPGCAIELGVLGARVGTPLRGCYVPYFCEVRLAWCAYLSYIVYTLVFWCSLLGCLDSVGARGIACKSVGRVASWSVAAATVALTIFVVLTFKARCRAPD